MKALNVSVIFISTIVLAGCTTQEVRYEYDRSFDFSSLRMFDWYGGPEEAGMDESTFASVRQAVEKELLGKGIRRVTANPDFLIAMRFTREVVRSEDWRGLYSRYEQERVVYPDYMYEQGRLTLDFLQPDTEKLLWRGWAEFETEAVRLQAELDKMAKKAVRKILRRFPPAR